MRVRRVGQFIREKFFGRSFRSRWASPLTGWGWNFVFLLPPSNDMVREKRGITREMAARLAISGLPSSSGSICRMLLRFIRSKRSFPRELRAIKPFAAAAAR
jgi:hypothetical protein